MCQPGTTLVLVREKTAYSLLFPQRSGPLSPGLAALAWPSSPPPPSPPATPAAPPCAASPQEPCCPLIWSDTATYSWRRSCQRRFELSQSPCGAQPSVPVFLWFSHHWAKPHGSSTPLHAEPTVVPPRLAACPPPGLPFLWWSPGGRVSTLRQTQKWPQLASLVSL